MSLRRIIDMHHHVGRSDTDEYASALVKVAKTLNIQKFVLQGISYQGARGSTNDRVLAVTHREPDLCIPFCGIDLWQPVDPWKVDRLKEKGCLGLKMILPPKPYHDESYYPYYQRAYELKMPILFHLGIIAREDSVKLRVDNNLMRPVYLDTIARSFPELPIIGAHFGNPWHPEAAMCCRWNTNLYFDLSGSTLKYRKPQFLQELLWWGGGTYFYYQDRLGRGAWEKIVFGSDVVAEDVHDVVNDYSNVISTLELSEEIADKIFYGTAVEILKWAGIPV